MDPYYGQAEQDKFVLKVLKEKRNGFFLEIGSNHPIQINNTYLLENRFEWKGIMIEYNSKWLNQYKNHRPNSIHIIKNATEIDYQNLLKSNNAPLNIDYLQIDLEVSNDSTIQTLYKLENDILDSYKFASITFEHDIYRHGLAHSIKVKNTRKESREILHKYGYLLVFKDIHLKSPALVFEDWYVHPDLVDMAYVGQLIERNKKNYINNPITKKSIGWKSIEYY